MTSSGTPQASAQACSWRAGEPLGAEGPPENVGLLNNRSDIRTIRARRAGPARSEQGRFPEILILCFPVIVLLQVLPEHRVVCVRVEG